MKKQNISIRVLDDKGNVLYFKSFRKGLNEEVDFSKLELPKGKVFVFDLDEGKTIEIKDIKKDEA